MKPTEAKNSDKKQIQIFAIKLLVIPREFIRACRFIRNINPLISEYYVVLFISRDVSSKISIGPYKIPQE